MGKVPRLLLVRCAALSLAVSGARGSSANVIEDSCYVRRFGVEGRLQFCLQDRVKHPLFSWPRTLLSYPVRFEEANVEPDQLVLRNLETGQEVPFQLSDVRTRHGRLLTATVNFFADLPSGAKGTFELSQAQGTPERARPSVKMKETRQSGSIVLDAGVLKVRIPVSQKTPQGQDVPGPIVQLQREDGPRRRSSQSEGGWIGESHTISSRKPIREIVSERVESGDLFITYRLTYQFAGGATYAATVRSVLGYDFVEFLEEVNYPRLKARALNLTTSGNG